MPISGGSGGGGLGNVVLTGTAAASKAIIATGANAAAWSYPPGFEIGYAEITANVNITDTAENTATQLIPGGPYTFDGGAVVAEFFTGELITDTNAAGDVVIVTLFEGATQIGRLAVFKTMVVAQNMVGPVYTRYRFTPTSGAHRYKLCAFATSTTGTPKIAAGSGGVGAFVPAYLRFTKV